MPLNVRPNNELQSLSISGDTLFISSGNYYFTILSTNFIGVQKHSFIVHADDGAWYSIR